MRARLKCNLYKIGKNGRLAQALARADNGFIDPSGARL